MHRLRPRAALRAHRRPGARAPRQPSTPMRGRARAPAFPAELWRRIEPLFGSAPRRRDALARDLDRRRALPDGRRRTAAPRRRPAASRTGASVAGGVAVVLDITARRTRRPDALAAAATDGFEEVFERAPIGTGLLDRDGRWLLVNRALCEITGYTSEELIGKRFDGIMHPEDAYNDVERARAPARRRDPRVPGREALLRRRRRDRLGDPLDVARARPRRRAAALHRPAPGHLRAQGARGAAAAASPTTTRSPACATAGCSSTTCSLQVAPLAPLRRGRRA